MNKGTLFLIIVTSLSFNLFAQDECEPCVFGKKNISTSYPTSPILDYSPSNVFSRVAFPTEENTSRIWIKGNEKFSKALIYSDQNALISQDTFYLSAPFYAEVVNFNSNSKEVIIKFFNRQNEIQTLKTTNFKKSDFATSGNDYSIVFYGCFQPFKVNKENKKPTIISSEDNLNYHMRNYFKNISLNIPIEHVNYLRNDSKPKNFFIQGNAKSPLISSPKLIIGTGDQIYVDAGYKYEGNKGDTWADIYRNHPISGWGYLCCDPEPLLSPRNYIKHLDKTYIAFNSFSTLDTVFQSLPSINIWDDHEIRDGWGSHGDEYGKIDGLLNKKLKPYYDASRKAFIEHQWTVGTSSEFENDLSQISSVNDFEIFAFDLRTNRNINDTTVLGADQLNKFKDWCHSIKDGKQIIIISSIPFFYGNTIWSEKQALKLTKYELSDDIKDSWGYNSKERNIILSELLKLRERNVKPIIVSGDVHVGAMSEIWYEPLEEENTRTSKGKVLCYELIASGLSHESLGEGQSPLTRILRDKSENQRWNDPTIRLYNDSIQIYPTTRISRPDLNFGAIEMKDDQLYLHLFTTENRNKENSIVQNTLNLNWDKSIEEDRALRYSSLKQVLFNMFNWKTKTYTPAPVETKKKVKID